MSTSRRGPPKHQNQYAWKPNAGVKINETEVGGRLRPFSDITGVCPRCREQIDWKRRYGKYKPLKEPAKCQRCSKRTVRQAYHRLCTGCAKEQKVCAKCCSSVDRIVGRDIVELEEEQKMLEEAIKNARERDRRTLLRSMNNKKSNSSSERSTKQANKVGELFPNASLEEYATQNRVRSANDVNIQSRDCVDNDDRENEEENDDDDESDDGDEDEENVNEEGQEEAVTDDDREEGEDDINDEKSRKEACVIEFQ